jgi:bacillolysin
MSLSLSSRRSAALLALVLGAASGSAAALPERLSEDTADALARLRANAGGEMKRNVMADSGFAQLRAAGSQPLMAGVAGQTPVERAQNFLSIYGAAIGVDHAATQLRAFRGSTDASGKQHVHLRQVHDGVPVFGARVAVHMTDAGVTGVSGVFVKNLDAVSLEATRDVTALRAGALAYAGKLHRGANLSIKSGQFVIYPVGLVQGHLQASRYAYEAIVGNGGEIKDRIFVDARTGEILDRFTLVPHVLNREAYNGDIATAPVLTETSLNKPADPPLINDPGHGATAASGAAPGVPADNLFVFAGGTWALYMNMFGRDGYDFCDGTGPCEPNVAAEAYSPLRAGGNHNLDFPGQIQQSVYLIGAACPNAYWNSESTNYCPGFDADDVVSHEWSHGYTEYTSNLVYAYQSGALNESYSDIFGETYDLTNNIEGPLGALTLDEHQYYEDGGSRWVVGEDLSEEAAALLLRDMWKPDDFPATTPGKATSGNFVCGSGDGGGVHTNSSVPNHAFAMIVDGTAGQGPAGTTGFERDSYNGQQFDGIGLIKAAHIYFQAQAHYQTETTDFPAHAEYLRASCDDLIGVNLKDPTGALSGQMITAADCEVVNKAMLATEMDLGSPTCPYVPVLKASGAPALCPGAATIFSEDWESGEGDWTKTSVGRFPEWEDDTRELRDFVLTNVLPNDHDSGTAAFAKNIPIGEPGGGTCQPGGDYSGAFTIDSPSFTIPAGAENLQIRFDHYVNTEATADGGQLEVSTDDGTTWTLVAQQDYIFNFPNSTLLGLADTSNNPDGGEFAWNGSDINAPSGAPVSNWGTTVVNLAAYATPGQTVKLRFKFAQEGCNGRDGWYIDDILVHSCPVLGIPTLTVESDYEAPDTDGSFTLSWDRPAGASGPDLIQVSETSCAPMVSDDAETDLAKWEATTEGTGAQAWSQSTTKANSGTNSFFTNYTNGADAAQLENVPASILTLKDAVTIPTEGETSLQYFDWFVHEGDDGIFVEVSEDDGATWVVLHQDQRFFGPEEAAPLLASEPMFARSHSLEDYVGKSIKVRFRFQSGGEDRPASTPFGWYLDDIAIVNDNWGDLLTTPDTSETLEGQLDGDRCYRVRTSFDIDGTDYPSQFSNIEAVTVDAGIIPPPPPVPGLNRISNNRLGGALHPATLLLLALVGLARRRR